MIKIPAEKKVTVFDYKNEPKQYTIRAFYPVFIRDMITRKQIDAEKNGEEFNEYETLLYEMSINPKIDEKFLHSEDCDAEEMDQLFIHILGLILQIEIDPIEYIGLSKEDAKKKMEEESKKTLLKKKEMRSQQLHVKTRQ